jgi:hypothetical protein
LKVMVTEGFVDGAGMHRCRREEGSRVYMALWECAQAACSGRPNGWALVGTALGSRSLKGAEFEGG